MSADARPNTVVRDVRETQFRMSREEFARHVNATAAAMGENTGCTARLIAAWERGEVASPRPVYERVLHEITGRSLADLGFATRRAPAAAVPVIPTRPYARRADDTDVERRTFLRDGAGSVTGIAMGDPRPRQSGRRMGMREVRQVLASTAAISSHVRDHGSTAMHHEAEKSLNAAHGWLRHGQFSESTGRLLRSATGELTVAVGNLAFDAGRHNDARSLFTESLTAARLAADPVLEARSFGCLSRLARESGRPREAVSAAQVARGIARSLGSPRMQALFAMREAGGWAFLGDRCACDAAIVDAHTQFEKGPRDSDPAWLGFFTPAELVGLESLCRADLGQHERAAYGAEQAVLLTGRGFTRSRALYTADIAVQNAKRERPDLDNALRASDEALSYLPQVQSRRLINAVRDIEAALQRHVRVPAVAAWLTDYHALGIA
ncbi:tetratricopeptide repeat protein [Actinacidiphila paucisporea]|uniref:Transcriptional regulator n=1 Tax=Actinacidiphila paucisporea TaxID=310782 RepID=A0A1M7PHC6_9ACTN|nr:tetratricopeptide repeat protein [Actinacidiphila paucisporea]SHN16453.1 hypothetical protein SAMN05216499_12391 [Actinacidiphila paucisporea]